MGHKGSTMLVTNPISLPTKDQWSPLDPLSFQSESMKTMSEPTPNKDVWCVFGPTNMEWKVFMLLLNRF